MAAQAADNIPIRRRKNVLDPNEFTTIAEIESQRKQIKHIVKEHQNELKLLRNRMALLAAARTGTKRAGSSIDAGSPKRMRTESQELP